MCLYCRHVMDERLMATAPSKLAGRSSGATPETEWQAVLQLARAVSRGDDTIKGWTPGTKPGLPTTPEGRTKASDYFSSQSPNIEVDRTGKVRKKMSAEELQKAKYFLKKRSLLLVDRLEVARHEIQIRKAYTPATRARLLEQHDLGVVTIVAEMLQATGPRARYSSKGLEWRQKWVPSGINSIENERLYELELAHITISNLTRLVAKLTETGDNVEVVPAEKIAEVLALAGDVEDRVCWGQRCTRRLAAKETSVGALRAGKEAAATFASAWRQGQDPTMTVADMEKAESLASEKAEADHIKAVTARANKPKHTTQPAVQGLSKNQKRKARRLQYRQQQQQQKGGGHGRGNGRGKGLKKKQRIQQQKAQQPNIQFLPLPAVQPGTVPGGGGNKPKGFPLSKKKCYACGELGHIANDCPN